MKQNLRLSLSLCLSFFPPGAPCVYEYRGSRSENALSLSLSLARTRICESARSFSHVERGERAGKQLVGFPETREGTGSNGGGISHGHLGINGLTWHYLAGKGQSPGPGRERNRDFFGQRYSTELNGWPSSRRIFSDTRKSSPRENFMRHLGCVNPRISE